MISPSQFEGAITADRFAGEVAKGTDPAHKLIEWIVKIVPASNWSFARLSVDGVSDELLLSGLGEKERRTELARLRNEHALQRQHARKGPLLSSTLGPFPDGCNHAITMLFATRRTEFGILNLGRRDELGPFSECEMRSLTLVLNSSADWLSGFPLVNFGYTTSPVHDSLAGQDSTMYVLDEELRIVLTWTRSQREHASVIDTAILEQDRLPVLIERTVSHLISDWTADPATRKGSTHCPLPFLRVRTQPLSGAKGLFVGVILERVPGSNFLTNAGDRFGFSLRELQTLALILAGETLDAVARTMNITPSTVQDHIKRMLEKTDSRNRSEMIGKVVGVEPAACWMESNRQNYLAS